MVGLVNEYSPSFVFRSADFGMFLAEEMTKIIPIIIDFTSYFGY